MNINGEDEKEKVVPSLKTQYMNLGKELGVLTNYDSNSQISVNIGHRLFEILKTFREYKIFTSRSEFVRKALDFYIKIQYIMIEPNTVAKKLKDNEVLLDNKIHQILGKLENNGDYDNFSFKTEAKFI